MMEIAGFVVAVATLAVDVAIFLLLVDWRRRDLARDRKTNG